MRWQQCQQLLVSPINKLLYTINNTDVQALQALLMQSTDSKNLHRRLTAYFILLSLPSVGVTYFNVID